MSDHPPAPDLQRVPAALAERHGVAALSLRPFGAAARDLEVDLRAGDRPGVVTEVLRSCAQAVGGAEPPEALFWELPVGVRTRALAALCARSGSRALERTVVCPRPGCREAVSLELPLADLLEGAEEAQPGPGEALAVEHGGLRLRLRRPTGEDLRRWAAEPPSEAEMLADLAEPPLPEAVSPALLAAAEEALAAADPLVDLRVAAACPACGAELEVPFDLEAEAVALLDRAQHRLLAEVASLAGAFHWSESEVLALPAWRRRRYLELVAREAP